MYFPGPSKEESFKREVEFLANLHFRYLINLVGSKIDGRVAMVGKPETIRPIIVLEFAEGGELFDYIAKEGPFPANICRSLFKMLIEAIEYMDASGVSHRDLKPENILFDKNYYLKVSDFGLSTLTAGHEGDGILYTRLGTEGYKPPEMEAGKYLGLQADLFAAGVVLFVMFSGTPPFISTKPTDKIYKLIRDKNYTKFWSLHERKKPGFFPDSFKRLLNAFFSAEVDRRPTFESLKEDEWINEGDASQEVIYQNLRAKYEHMLVEDQNKQLIERAKLEMYDRTDSSSSSKINPYSVDEEGSGFRDLPAEFKERVDLYGDLTSKDLPVSEKKQLPAISRSPAFLLAWIGEWMSNAEKEGKTFLKDYALEVKAEEYSIEFDKEKMEVQLKFTYDVEDEQEELEIVGKLLCIGENKVTIDWEKVSGNEFWLGSVIGELNRELKVLV